MRGLFLGLSLLCATAVASAQLAFDVASIKENREALAPGFIRFLPDGGVAATDARPFNLIVAAFQLRPYQLTEAPSWTSQTFFNITAKPPAPATREKSLRMLQALLIDWFHLTFHREGRELNGYALVQKRLGELGPQLKPSTVHCAVAFATTPRCRESALRGTALNAVGSNFRGLIDIISSRLSTAVDDDTKLTGTFDFTLQWSDGPDNLEFPVLPTALEEQLGLKLERRRVTAEMFVIDSIERPTPD